MTEPAERQANDLPGRSVAVRAQVVTIAAHSPRLSVGLAALVVAGLAGLIAVSILGPWRGRPVEPAPAEPARKSDAARARGFVHCGFVEAQGASLESTLDAWLAEAENAYCQGLTGAGDCNAADAATCDIEIRESPYVGAATKVDFSASSPHVRIQVTRAALELLPRLDSLLRAFRERSPADRKGILANLRAALGIKAPGPDSSNASLLRLLLLHEFGHVAYRLCNPDTVGGLTPAKPEWCDSANHPSRNDEATIDASALRVMKRIDDKVGGEVSVAGWYLKYRLLNRGFTNPFVPDDVDGNADVAGKLPKNSLRALVEEAMPR